MNNITLRINRKESVVSIQGKKMALVKASLKLFGGDTVVVRCSERCHIHLMSNKAPRKTQADILSVQNRDSAWLTVPLYRHLGGAHRQPQPVA
ncbi:Uncharacterised protein [Leclercia adecarboxylata]|uniref:Uncharacterized protein n=1 Tax=Leclercia adecarboxylata TaxID=83655 RepID=A0A4U9HZ26_9ENTR|nr:Uncharacterised protein [Leclercia adecarboxylata]